MGLAGWVLQAVLYIYIYIDHPIVYKGTCRLPDLWMLRALSRRGGEGYGGILNLIHLASVQPYLIAYGRTLPLPSSYQSINVPAIPSNRYQILTMTPYQQPTSIEFKGTTVHSTAKKELTNLKSQQ